MASPSARFLQYRATLRGPAELDEVDVAYQMKNVAPVVEEVEITPANYKFPAPSSASAPANPPLSLPPLGRNRPPAPGLSSSGDSGSSPTLTWSKGQIGARWLANDDNGDTITFKVEIRGENETGWKLLKDNLREHYYSWDSTAFPDGKYVLRVTASDAPSNPPDQALNASLESDPFLMDNTPPEITGLTRCSVRQSDRSSISRQGRSQRDREGRVFGQRRRLGAGGTGDAADRFHGGRLPGDDRSRPRAKPPSRFASPMSTRIRRSRRL